MVRKNLVLDERLLEEAFRLSGERTYSGVVQRALGEYVRRIRARRILALGEAASGKGAWRRCAAIGPLDEPGPPVVLVGTSVWVEFFRKPARIDLPTIVDLDEVVTCLPVLQEVLQGFREETAFALARDAMLALPMVEAPLEQEVVEEAVGLYRRARASGLATTREGSRPFSPLRRCSTSTPMRMYW